jgi:hypothetical protein
LSTGANKAAWAVTRLTNEFGSDFFISNLKYIRQFYLVYPERVPQIGQTGSGQFPVLPIVQILSGKLQDASGQSQPQFSLSWSYYAFLLGLKEEDLNFY